MCTKNPAAEGICIKAEKEGYTIDSLLMPDVCRNLPIYKLLLCFYLN